MEKFTLSKELINEVAQLLATLPYAQVVGLISKMRQEIEPQEESVPTPPAPTE